MLKIDGSYGEGGGQIIRALTLSAITKKPFHITKIRSNREKSGLQPQHLLCCHAVKEICNGILENASVGCSEFIFFPDNILADDYIFDVGTAGSTLLPAQTIIPILLHGSKKSSVCLIGGTHLPHSPSYDCFEKVFLHAISKFGANVESKLIQPGYYPRGGGSIELTIIPSDLHGYPFLREKDNTHGIIRLSRLPEHIAEREKHVLIESGINEIQTKYDFSYSSGNSLTIWQGFNGVDVLGQRGKLAEIVASEAIDLFWKEKEVVDFHLADQLLLYASLAKGETHYTTSKFSEHLRTNAYVISLFLDRDIRFNKHTVSIV